MNNLLFVVQMHKLEMVLKTTTCSHFWIYGQIPLEISMRWRGHYWWEPLRPTSSPLSSLTLVIFCWLPHANWKRRLHGSFTFPTVCFYYSSSRKYLLSSFLTKLKISFLGIYGSSSLCVSINFMEFTHVLILSLSKSLGHHLLHLSLFFVIDLT